MILLYRFRECTLHRTTEGMSFHPGSSGAPPPRRTRSRARRTRTAAARASGTASPRRPGKVAERRQRSRSPATPTTAIRDDIALMRELGLDAFRFSIAWPRIVPEGRGARERGRASTSTTASSTSCSRTASSRSSTLYHWDLPQALEDRRRLAGARHRRGVRGVRRGRRRAARRPRRATGSRTNEPWVIAWLGYGLGRARARPDERRATRSPRRTTCCSRTGARSR